MKIQLKINGEWAVLPPDFSLKMMKTSPLFSDQGDFSYPFELPVEPNRHIFGPIADPMGFVRLREFHALPAEIWFEGNQVFVGQTEISGEQTFSQRGKVSFNVVSNNGAFKDMINGMNCRDVKLKDEIKLGWRPRQIMWRALPYKQTITTQIALKNDNVEGFQPTHSLHDVTFSIDTEVNAIDIPVDTLFPTDINVSMEYPHAKYCNVRLCSPKGAPSDSGSSSGNSSSTGIASSDTPSGGYGYELYETDRLNAAPSFYVLYFLDCLFAESNLDIVYDNHEVLTVPDLSRLAMLNVAPQFDDGQYLTVKSANDFLVATNDPKYSYLLINGEASINVRYDSWWVETETEGSYETHYGVTEVPINKTYSIKDAQIFISDCYANGKNFSNTDVGNVIDDLKNAFGILFDYDQWNNKMTLHLVKDIFKDDEVLQPQCTILQDVTITRSMNNGQILSYGVTDDTDYCYNMPNGTNRVGSPDPVIYDNFLDVSSAVRHATDKVTKYDKSTCNAFRVKVNKDTGKEPQLFPVASYRDYKIGISKNAYEIAHKKYKDRSEYDEDDLTPYTDRDESKAEKTEIHFRPVTVNDIWSWWVNKPKTSNSEYEYPASSTDQMLAVFVNEESYAKTIGVPQYEGSVDKPLVNKKKEYVTTTVVGNQCTMASEQKKGTEQGIGYTYDIQLRLTLAGELAYDLTDETGAPLRKADIGYQLGFMRGPGNESGEDLTRNYDDEGNDTWEPVPKGPAFTADSIDNYGQIFDYNGSAEGIGDEWETKRMTSDEALKHLKTIFSRSNVSFEDERAAQFVYFVNISGVVMQPFFNYICCSVDKDGNNISEDEVSAYMIKLVDDIGYNKLSNSLSELYKEDKSRKNILIFAETGPVVKTYVDSYASLINVYSSGESGYALIKVDPLEGRLSLKLDARKVKGYDNDGNPIYFDVTDNTIARRGLVPQLLEDFLYFKAHHVKVTFHVLMSLSAINNLQLLKWNRFGDYVGLIKQVNYELTESGLKNVTVELLVANK